MGGNHASTVQLSETAFRFAKTRFSFTLVREIKCGKLFAILFNLDTFEARFSLSREIN